MTSRSGFTLREVAPGILVSPDGNVRKIFCMDCGEEDPMTFVVKDEVWIEAKLNRGYICWFCLEKRLRRKLKLADLRKPEPPKHPILANKHFFLALRIAKRMINES